MPQDLNVALTITAKDQASDKVRSVGREAERQAERVGDRTRRAAEGATRAQERSNQRTQTTAERSNRAQEQSGVQSQSRVRRAIESTTAAYRRLTGAALSSAADQSRAYGRMTQGAIGLGRELTRVAGQHRRLGLGARAGSMGLRVGASLLAGGVAGGVALASVASSAPVKRTMSYESRLAMMANTAFSDRDVPGRIAGTRELKEAVANAVRIGGGSRDSAADTLDALLASGAVSQKSAVKLLPTLQKAAVATGAQPTDLAQVAIRGMQTFGIKESEIPKALDMAVKAGQEGGFEIKDMARWLPMLMANAKSSGMSGLKDFGSLLAVAQSSLITGGTPDAAGNNLANLLAKINSRDTSLMASKIKIAPGKSIDLSGTLTKAASKGINGLDAFVGIVDKVVAGNKQYQAIQKQLQDPSLDKNGRAAILGKQADILQGSAIGQLVPDRQAVLALVGYMGNRKYVKDIETKLAAADGTVDLNHQVIASTGAFKVDRLESEKQDAEFNAFKSVSDVAGDAAGKLADLAKEYPGLTASVMGATQALKALALVAGSVIAVNMLRGRTMMSSGAAAAGGLAAGELAAGRGAAAAGRSLGWLRPVFRRAGIAGAVGMGAYETYSIASDPTLTSQQKKAALAQSVGGLGGSVAGAAAGAVAGTMLFPGVGTAIGALAGGIGGNFLGDELAQRIGSSMFPATAGTSSVRAEDIQAAATAAIAATKKEPQAIDLKVTVDVQNGNIVASVNNIIEQVARRN